MTDIQADLFQFPSHTQPDIAAKAETGLFFNVGQREHIKPLSATGWRLHNARNPRALTFMTWHIRPMENADWWSLINLNLTAFGWPKTPWLFLGFTFPP
jgi:hypothetical protein